MKTTTLFIALLTTLFITNAQSQTIDNRKFIEVTGSAEMSILPDEVELEIILVEYDKNGKKVKLEDIETAFYGMLKTNGIEKESLLFVSSTSDYWWYWWNHRNAVYQSKTVNIKLNSKTNLLKLVEDLDTKWVQSIRVSKTTSKEMQQLRKEVKKQAMIAAKEKATYLLESVGEKIGGVLSVEEIPDAQNDWYNRPLGRVSNSVMADENKENSGIANVTEIKLRYEIKAKFEIK